MIEINLLPEYLRGAPEQEQEKKRGEAILKKNVFLLIAGPAVVMFGIYLLGVVAPTGVLASRAARLDREWGSIKNDFGQVESVLNRETRLRSVEAQLKSQKASGNQWSRVLNSISDATPPNVQLSSVGNEFAQETVIEKKMIMEGGKKVEREQRGVKVRQILTIAGGYAPKSKDDNTIEIFVGSMKSLPVFQELFQTVELLSLEATKENKKNFVIKCWFKDTAGADEKADKRP